ncbi:glycosyltransferase [Jannaschia sp. LMIT008]|uniref:glycosyltransferase n=1 Tax=Jannaschia maritima TaxID=3032585 RepID=UPI00281201CE|nr:glycosyltransferase [Jannaschia sp. LMIT008]
MKTKIAFFLPHFDSGGAEGVVLRVLNGLDRDRFVPELLLQDRRGALLERLPGDVPVVGLRPSRPPLCVPALARCARERGLALVAAVNNANNLYALAASRMPGAAFATLVMEHTPPSAFLREAKRPMLRRWLMGALYPKADLAAGPLDEIGSDLDGFLGERAPPYLTLPNPVVDRLHPPGTVPKVATRIVSVGRLAPEKRFDLLIDAFAIAHAARPDIRLTIVGEGPERGALQTRIDAADLRGVVSLPGYRADVDAVHAESDLFVCTSRREGLGNAIIEAMARGVPVLSVDCPFGPRRLLRGGAAGTLLASDDAVAIATGILDVIADPALRQRHVLVGQDAIGAYDAASAVRGYANAFDAAIASRAARAGTHRGQ